MKKKLNNEELFKKGMYDELYKANIRFIYKQAKKFTKLPFEECVSAGNFGFAKAVKSYNPNNNIKFLTYASRIIINEMLMLFRKEKKYFNDISFDGVLYTGKEGNQLTLEDTLQDDTDIQGDLIHKSDIKALKNAIQLLPKKYADIMQLHLKELNQKQIAEATGLSQSYVSRLLIKAIERLKILMGSDIMSKKDDALKLIKEGLSNQQIAERLDTSPSTISVYRTKYNESMKPKVFELLDKDIKVVEISSTLHISKNTIQRYQGEWIEKHKTVSQANIEKDFQEMAQRDKAIQEIKSGTDESLHFNPVKLQNSKPKPHILKVTQYQSDLMYYSINDNSINIRSKENASNIDVSKENIDLLIQELKELKEVL